MRSQFWIAWQMQRWELSLLVGSGLALTTIALVLPSLGEAGIGDQRMIVLFLALAGPVVMGSVLGVGVVAGELEHRTASIAWSLAPGRMRWLWLRAWPIALVGLMIGVLVGAGTARLMDVTSPSDIFMHQMRGPVVALRFVAAFGVAVVIGAVIRRVVPALLVALVAAVALSVSSGLAIQEWQRDQAVLVPFAERSAEPVIAMLGHELATVDSDGSLIMSEPTCSTRADCMEAMANMTPMMLVVPGSAYWALLALEALVAAVVVAMSLLGTTAITRRWGPR